MAIEIRDQAYRSGTDRGLLDIFLPEGAGPFPIVLCYHGGGWRNGDKKNIQGYVPFLLSEGLAAVCPNYRLTGTHPHPAQEDDIFATLAWLLAHAKEYRLDPKRIGLTGASAGGHLSMLGGVKAARRAPKGCVVRCTLPICGVSDVALWLNDRPIYLDHVRAFLGGEPSERRAIERDASPIAHIHRDTPPCLAVHGDADDVCPVNQSALFIEALRAVGVEAELLIVPGVGHTSTMPNTNPPEPLGGAKVFQEFFRKHLL